MFAINKILLLFFSVSFLAACSNVTPIKQAEKPLENSSHETLVMDLKTLQSIEKIAHKLAKHRTVFIGESHTDYTDHLNQLAIIKVLHKKWEKQISVGLEMVQQPYQSYLDHYVSGKITEKELLRGIEWYERWQFDFRLYRPIFNYARQHKIPLVALNIPKELTKKITQVGISHLSPKERKQLPVLIDRSNSRYVARIKKVFGEHSHTSSKGFEKFLDAQLGWDEGMAFAAAKYLKKHPAKNMVILAGSGHVINYQGIPNRLDRQTHHKSVVILNRAEKIAGSDLQDLADYILFSPEQKLPKKGHFGMGMENASVSNKAAKGVLVTLLSQHGAAKKAGLKKGDIIIGLNNQVVDDIVDIRLFAEKTHAGSKVNIKIKRHGKIQAVQAQLKSKLSKSSLMHKR